MRQVLCREPSDWYAWIGMRCARAVVATHQFDPLSVRTRPDIWQTLPYRRRSPTNLYAKDGASSSGVFYPSHDVRAVFANEATARAAGDGARAAVFADDDAIAQYRLSELRWSSRTRSRGIASTGPTAGA